MPRLTNRAEIHRRIAAIRADRARGLTFTQIGKVHGVSKTFAHWAARHVPVALYWRRWHLARWCKPEPPPTTTARIVHQIYARGR